MKFQGKLRMDEYISSTTTCVNFFDLKSGKDKESLSGERAGREMCQGVHWVPEDRAGQKEEKCGHPRSAHACKIACLEKQKVVHRWESERCLQRTS